MQERQLDAADVEAMREGEAIHQFRKNIGRSAFQVKGYRKRGLSKKDRAERGKMAVASRVDALIEAFAGK
jgi:hypothetical protein